MKRLIAVLILFIPGAFAVYGIKLMRDMLFAILQPPFPALWLQFICGLLFFAGGLGFVSGFIFYRDRKRNKVQDKFRKSVRPLPTRSKAE
ncbi:DUF2627 domain-containing protein [Peribacillus kribbensis]|uniref:DUF2627 domain-containing protein n=1 Tax=Peribacillus kribbensis TaxID=356658 RepID=UPI000418FBB6|nr:DUF2627 domain-containing protein [Peribacillus kribbensis]